MARTDRERVEIWVLSVGAPGHEQPAALSPGELSLNVHYEHLSRYGWKWPDGRVQEFSNF